MARDERKVTLRSGLRGRRGDSRSVPRCWQGSPPPSTSWAYFRKRAACQIMRRECCWCIQPFSFLLVQSERIQPGLFADNSRLTSSPSGPLLDQETTVTFVASRSRFSWSVSILGLSSSGPGCVHFSGGSTQTPNLGDHNASEMTERELGKD